MYWVSYLQVCFVLVSSNPLYDFNCCPTTYPTYGNDQPFVVQRSNYNPYPLDLLVHDRLNPLTQSVPHQYQYLNTNNYLPNHQLYNQNGLDILQHVPETGREKVINNYILIPQEYFHSNAIENERDKNTEVAFSKNDIKNNKNNKGKRRRPNVPAKIKNGSTDISNPETKTTRSKGRTKETESTKNGRPKSMKKYNQNNSKLLTTDVEETPSLKRVKNHGEALIKITDNHLISSYGKKVAEKNNPIKKNNNHEPKTTKELKTIKKEVVNDYISDVATKSKKNGTGFADVNVCFDINEDCTDLVCRHTRNKDVNKKNKSQSPNSQPDLHNNFNNYMSGLTFNQQMNPNVNFPFNFDYLYQMPQTNNKQKDSNSRRRNKKRKQPPSNRQTNSNKKNQNLVTTVDSCDKVVELTPEIHKIETTTVATKTTTITEETESKNVVQEETTLEKDQDSNLKNPKRTYTETLLTEVLNNDQISNNNMDHHGPFDNYNDVIDEYYPDFTLDNSYISSKEDYEFGNFHDRYYYAYGDKPELNRERRTYEHPIDNKLDRHRKFNKNFQKNSLQEPSQIQEILCKTDMSKEKVKLLTRPALEFPGFKTEMINKEKYFAKEEYDSKNYDINGISTNKMCPKHAEGKENQHNNNVEMVFANSKVVRYGPPEKEETISKVPEPEGKKEFKNLISNDGKTTVVIAKSLGYSY